MIGLSQKKVGKLIGLKKADFNQLIRDKEISLSKPRLIPVFKLGDEMALTSVLLSAFRLIKEFKEAVFSESKIQKGGTLYVYTEVAFKDFPDSRIDGLLLIVKAGVIRDAAILEMKNGKDVLDKDQVERYQKIAKLYAIPKFLTISNEFVSDATQSPVVVKNIRGVDMYHFSWTYLLTIAHILLFKKDVSIEDEDQVEIMREVVNYLEHDKSGVVGVNQMSASWVGVVEKINAGANLKVTDDHVYGTVHSWQQEERDMALALSRELGVLVTSGDSKYKGKLEERLKSDCKELIVNKKLESVFKVKGAVSDIKVSALFEKRTVEMMVLLKPPSDMTYKGQLGWMKRQLDSCAKKDEKLFGQIAKELYLEVLIKNSRVVERFTVFDFESAVDVLKGKEIREFRILYLKDFGKKFSSTRKFVVVIEAMLREYYKAVIQHMVRWEPKAPKIDIENKEEDNEDFIEEVNSMLPSRPMDNVVTETLARVIQEGEAVLEG
ncbi:hypothetical protein [Dasania marina]|uniref:hypothetical protein n=1 Tax=Dasania marina TaxID=471499 RepID=UPI0030DD5073